MEVATVVAQTFKGILAVRQATPLSRGLLTLCGGPDLARNGSL